MPLLGSIIKGAIEIRSRIPAKIDAYQQQRKQLRWLLGKAEETAIGRHFNFADLALREDPIRAFQKTVPLYDYQAIFDAWWHRALKGEKNVCWPGKVKYFALSSGTAESSSKHIPVTREQIKAIHKATLKQILSTRNFAFKRDLYETDLLFIGGSTSLNYNGSSFSGDLSGITTGSQPRWFQNFTLPGTEITDIKDWEHKLQAIVGKAKQWNVGFICGVPAWIQIIFERIIEKYKVRTIHDVWPNLQVLVHGGVAIHPYRSSLNRLCARPLIYIDTYMASEGYLAFQARPNDEQAMRLLTDNKVFFEFIPFTEENFDADGNVKPLAKALSIAEVDAETEYALLISNCSGAWRYLIGDTIRFTDLKYCEILITGRTRHFLSLCGEHLSVDNMNQAVKLVGQEMGLVINEYCVAGVPHEGLFAHRWYVGTDKPADSAEIAARLDEHLKRLNDDYAVERRHALREISVEILPNQAFIDFLASKNKLGGQSKFPRVVKGKNLNNWLAFLESYKKATPPIGS